MSNRDTAKSWFETGDYPTQAQFAQLFDWILFSGEATIADVQNLSAVLAGKVDTSALTALQDRILPTILNASGNISWLIPNGLLIVDIVIVPASGDLVKIGTALDGDELAPQVQLVAAKGNHFKLLPAIFGDGVTTIYFTGFTAATQIYIYKK